MPKKTRRMAHTGSSRKQADTVEISNDRLRKKLQTQASIMVSATPFCSAKPLLSRSACDAMALSHVHAVLLLRQSLAWHAPTARFVCQSLDALLQKSLRPLSTKRRLIPIVAAMAAIGTPSATSTLILPRLAHPAETVVARCHASSVRRSADVRWMVRVVLRPRALERPCVIHV